MERSDRIFWRGFMDGLSLGPVWRGIRDLWCDYTHGGGHVLRDPSGCVNWQCAMCGRWAMPVSKADEARAINGAATPPKDAEGQR